MEQDPRGPLCCGRRCAAPPPPPRPRRGEVASGARNPPYRSLAAGLCRVSKGRAGAAPRRAWRFVIHDLLTKVIPHPERLQCTQLAREYKPATTTIGARRNECLPTTRHQDPSSSWGRLCVDKCTSVAPRKGNWISWNCIWIFAWNILKHSGIFCEILKFPVKFCKILQEICRIL